jgi:2-polyprenyl-3-methyl-5-hydroxy-6-metoxy-1,4-benzoquinol methylase
MQPPSPDQKSPDRRFSKVASDNAQYRADYAAKTIDKILEGFADPSQLLVIDVGAGTGIASRQLPERGARVFAIEPDPAMIEVAISHPQVEFREAAAETTHVAVQVVALCSECSPLLL